jgi:hypothetical protein
MPAKKPIFRIVFIQNDAVVELYAKHVAEAEHLFGFVVVEDFLFGEKSSLVVDPSEERLKALFHDVKCTYIPLQEIVRIDEMEKQGTSKMIPINKGSNRVTPFPPHRTHLNPL